MNGANMIEVQVIQLRSHPDAATSVGLPAGSEGISMSTGNLLYEAISVDDIGRSIAQVSGTVLQAIKAINPQSCTVEFSLGIKAGAKVPILVSGEANATFKVTLAWKEKSSSGKPGG